MAPMCIVKSLFNYIFSRKKFLGRSVIFYIQINPLHIKKLKDDDGWGSSCALWAKRGKRCISPKAGRRARIARRGKEKNKTEKEYVQRKTENSYAGSRSKFICTYKQLLDHCTTVPLSFQWSKFFTWKPFSSFTLVTAVWSWWSCIYHEFRDIFEEKLAYAHISRLFRIILSSKGRSM